MCGPGEAVDPVEAEPRPNVEIRLDQGEDEPAQEDE
jgi:hypothetical protein